MKKERRKKKKKENPRRGNPKCSRTNRYVTENGCAGEVVYNPRLRGMATVTPWVYVDETLIKSGGKSASGGG